MNIRNRNLVEEQEILNEISIDAPFRQLFMTIWWKVFNHKKSRSFYYYTIIKRYDWEKSYRLTKEFKIKK